MMQFPSKCFIKHQVSMQMLVEGKQSKGSNKNSLQCTPFSVLVD